MIDTSKACLKKKFHINSHVCRFFHTKFLLSVLLFWFIIDKKMNRYIQILRSKVKEFVRAGKIIVNDPVLDDLQKFSRFFYCWPEQKKFHWRKALNWIQVLMLQCIPSFVFLCNTKDFQLGLNTFCELVGLELYLIQCALITYHQDRLSSLIKRIRQFWYRCK